MATGNRRLERLGWLLFALCALLYIIANVRARDWLSLFGSILFLLACFVFVLKVKS